MVAAANEQPMTENQFEASDDVFVFPASFGQRRLWFLDQFEPNSPYYNIPAAVRLSGSLDVAALERTFNEIIHRHEALRTTFTTQEGEPMQVIWPRLVLSLPVTDLSGLPAAEREAEALRLATEEARQSFNLSKGPLLRVRLLRLAETEHIVLLTMHHIISDGWSIGVFMSEIASIYSAFAAGKPSPLPELTIQYADYAEWQRTWLQGEVLERQIAYWKQQLAGQPALLELPTDRPRPAVYTSNGATCSLRLSRSLSDDLNSLSRKQGVTLFITLLTAFQTLLYRYTGQDDISVGTPIANRTRAEVEGLIGLFINTLVLRSDLSGDPTFGEALQRVREVALQAYAHQDLPFEMLVEALQPERDMSHTPLFQVMFILQNAGARVQELPGLTMQMMDIDSGTATFDLTISVGEGPDGLDVSAEFNTDLFNTSTIERLLRHYERLLQGIVVNPDEHISRLPILLDSERKQLFDWNKTQVAYPNDVCVHQLFEHQVARTPQAIAVTFGDAELTYDELNRRANQLAHYLRACGVKPGVLVGICIERSVEMIVAVWAVLKAGGAYVPLDPTYPQERLTLVVEDTRSPVLITQDSLISRLSSHQARLVCIDGDWPRIADESTENLPPTTTPDDLVYVIYTSGSTGRPKGVMVRHRSLVNAYFAWEDAYRLRTDVTSHLQMASFSFDVFAGDLVRALCSGGKLVLCPRDYLLAPQQLYGLMVQQKVDCAEFVPAVLRNLADYVEENDLRLDFLRLLICGSDSWYVGEYKRFQRLCSPQTRLINSFGVTEATIDSSYFEGPITNLSDDSLVPIGRPFPNTRLYILDEHMQMLPVGVPGELYIGGPGVAAGYLHRDDLTAERFVPDPFVSQLPDVWQASASSTRLYKTGDRARYLADGNIEFLGRMDFQVKIRGFRIEPGEVEAVLGQHPGLHNAVVVARANDQRPGENVLVAYVVPTEQPALSVGDLRRFLQDRLPDYMIPSSFVVLESLPLLPNGKINRNALPAPDWTQRDAEHEFIAPRTPTEEVLAGIWGQVLGIERVSVADNFFDLGGHSLLATQVVSRIRTAFQVELPLRNIFESPTIAALADVVDQARLAQRGLQAPPIRPVPRQGDLPLSFSQQRLWFLDQLEPGNPSYNMTDAVRLQGPLDSTALEHSLNEIIRRHEILRTTFVSVNGRPTQIIAPELELSLPVSDLANLPGDEQQAEIARLIGAEAQQPFDLARGPLLRARLLRLGKEDHIALLTVHHIIGDDWSSNVLTQEMAILYDAFSHGRPSPLPELPLQYADFAAWQRAWLQGDVLEVQLGYWKERLAGSPPLLELPTDRPRPAVQTFRGAYTTFALPVRLSEAIKNLSRKEGTTLFMTLLAAFQMLLYRYTGQEDILVGTPIANRTRAELEGLIGFFVNTLVMRTDFSGEPNCRELLKRVRETCLGAYAHQDVPFELVVDAVQPERNLSHSPLFQVMFVLQNTPRRPQQISSELTIGPVEAHSGTAKFDLTMFVIEEEDHLSGAIEYNTDLFDAATIARMIGHFQTLLEGLTADPEQPVWRLPILTEAERRQILIEWNDTQADVPFDRCAHELFEEQVKRTPDAMAAVYQDQRLTYGELNARANQLAHHLQKLGVGPETLVGICTQRSLDMVVGLLGILKAGGAYVPLDPTYPHDRLAYMIEDAQTPVLLTQSDLADRLPHSQAQVICLDRDWPFIAGEPEDNPVSGVTPDNLAYVIYTSGSTGKPKGTLILHRGLVNYLTWCRRAYPLDVGEGAPVHSSISFDLTVTALFAPLVAGRAVHLVPEDLGIETLVAALRQQPNFSLVKITPAHLQMLNQQLSPAEAAGRTHAFIIGGENLLAETIAFWQKHAPDALLVNEYGPTETVVGCCVYCVPKGWSEAGSVPIGRPIINTQLYILDAHLQPVPIGVRGELYIGGAGVARGYLNRPDLTAERFIADPFSLPTANISKRLYKTGDICRYRPDGVIEYFGRADSQVKIRGFRVELGEIEAVLGQYPAVKDVVVIVREDIPGNRRLVAYIVPTDSAVPDIDDMRTWLKKRLPEYMVPSAIVPLPGLPLTPNGKVDRRALPAPDAEHAQGRPEYVAPRTWAETVLADIWAQVLGVERVGVNDNFFELGGDSILSIQVISRANQAGLHITAKQLFQAPTVAGLAALAETGTAIAAEQGLVTGPVILTPIQHWFFEQEMPYPQHWNQSLLLESTTRLDADTLEETVRCLLQHHDALRLRFAPGEVSWEQQIVGMPKIMPFQYLDMSSLDDHDLSATIEHVAADIQAGLNLEQGPLLRVALIEAGEHRPQRLLIVVHHLVVDGVSWRILLEDMQTAYQQLSRGQDVHLPPKTTSYQVWAQRLAEYAQTDTVRGQLDFWLGQPAGVPKSLPLDRSGSNSEGSAEIVSVTLTEEETFSLLHDVPALYHSEINDVLLTALAQALSRWTGSASVLVDLEGHGRVDLSPDVDVSRTVGWFTSLYPVRLDTVGDDPIQTLRAVQEHLRRIPEQGIGYGLLRYLCSDPTIGEQLAALPEPQVSFNYLGQFDQMLAESNVLRPARESTGPERHSLNARRHVLDINGGIAGGRLQVEWAYSRNLHRRQTIEGVAHDFISALQTLIKQGQPPDLAQAMAKDFKEFEEFAEFKDFGWSEDDLGEIMNEITKKK